MHSPRPARFRSIRNFRRRNRTFVPMLLARVVETSRRISETSKRLEKTALLAGLLKELKPEEVETVAGFLAGAPRQGRIGIGYAALHSSMAAAAVDAATIEVLDVDRVLDEISAIRGAGSEQRKRELLGGLFARATNEEQHFLVRLLSGELRQGALEGILLDALAKASGISSERIRRAAMMAGGAAAIARAALEKGESGLSPFDIQLFRPVQPMLAQTAEDLGAALSDLGEASLEYKLDGARIQVHKAGDQVAIFSRGANDVTAAVPEVVQLVRALPAQDLILDGEVLSLSNDGRPQPFQVSMRRFGRKLDVARLMDELPMTPFWFDLLYLNGSPLVDEAQAKRFAELALLAPSQNVIPNLMT